jgi:hypothetical protein
MDERGANRGSRANHKPVDDLLGVRFRIGTGKNLVTLEADDSQAG